MRMLPCVADFSLSIEEFRELADHYAARGLWGFV